ncbi:MAG: SGNH/GDSL hydrolase family protein [Planctomycetota bacterium]
MIYQDVELHGVEELRRAEGQGGLWLQRVPERLRSKVNPGAQQAFRSPACAEIRFVSDGPARVTLASENVTKVSVFFGSFGLAEVLTIGPEACTLAPAPFEHLSKANPDNLKHMPFSPRVTRLMLGGGAVRLISVEGKNVRPPRPQELPGLRLLTYGTSITHGACATAPHLCYAAQTARRLAADLINLGVGGSCQCEKELADYVAARKDWHAAVLALSVNMRGFKLEEYTERINHIVDKVAGADTNRPVACVTLYPYFGDLGPPWDHEPNVLPSKVMRQVLRDAVAAAGHPNLHLVEGPEILTDIGGLTSDLIHPADNGMIQIGENLAKRLAPLVENLGAADKRRAAAP